MSRSMYRKVNQSADDDSGNNNASIENETEIVGTDFTPTTVYFDGNGNNTSDDDVDLSAFRDVINSRTTSLTPAFALTTAQLFQQQQQQQQQQHQLQQQYRAALFTSVGSSLDYDFFEDMDERDSIYLDAVSLSSDGTNRKSLYLSRQTVYHSAEELPLDTIVEAVDGGHGNNNLRHVTEAMLHDARGGGNGELPNMHQQQQHRFLAGASGILKRPGGKYNNNGNTEEVASLLARHSSPSSLTTCCDSSGVGSSSPVIVAAASATSPSSSSTTIINQMQMQTQTIIDRKHEPRQIVTYSLWKTRVNEPYILCFSSFL
ncbi:uncharacterized protein LOC129753026 [Uranotaenia lowii]|uniref:uncharacterized protein LOC129753026 n=1 Tax=Uranotaenia lowii TaxID=190385 RepID=UPI002478F1F3|nr:uncharacterized protein LOC129753026 [Uranotaenia lowii]